jgi:hypothetical protein
MSMQLFGLQIIAKLKLCQMGTSYGVANNWSALHLHDALGIAEGRFTAYEPT